MARRMISDSIWKNEKFASLPFGARLLLIGMVTNADDQGRGKAHPAYLRAEIFPYDDMPLTDINKWLQLVQDNQTIIIYNAEGKNYYQFTNWWEYQSHPFAAPSDYPKPPNWTDRVRTTTKGRVILTCNWISSDNTLLPDTCDEHGKPLPLNQKQKPPEGKENKQEGNHAGNQAENQVDDRANDHVVDQVDNQVDNQREREIESKREKTTTARASEGASKPNSGGGSSDSSEPLPKHRNRQTDKDYAAVCSAIENNGFGLLTPIMADEINDLLNDFPLAWILDAMKVSVEANKRQLRYVRGVLSKWRADGRDSPPTANLGHINGAAILSQSNSGTIVQGDIGKLYRG